MKSWFRKSKKELKLNYYDSLKRLPVGIWWEIQDDINQLPRLLIDKVEVTDEVIIKLIKVWEQLYDQFIDRFTIGSSYKNLLRLKAEVYELHIAYLTGEGNYTHWQVALGQLQEMEQLSNTGLSNFETKALMQKHYGHQIDIFTTSVEEYYSMAELMHKHGGN